MSSRDAIALYYREKAAEFVERTRFADPAAFLSNFVAVLPEAGHVLDVGCGSGRDMVWLCGQGFRVEGFERSPELAAVSRIASGCKVTEGDFETFDFSRFSVHGLLMSGALVHLPRDRFPDVLASVSRAIRPAGSAYLSLKAGDGELTDPHGRFFTLWSKAEVEAVFRKLGFRVMAYKRQVSNVGTDWHGWVFMVP